MITNSNCVKQTVNYDLGYSDHFAQVTHIRVNKPVIGPKIIEKRRFSDLEIKEFVHYLQTESWDQVLLQDDVNESFNAFMAIFIYYFNTMFPSKNHYLHNSTKNKWITKGLIISRNKLRFLNGLKRSNLISSEFRLYISKYQSMYKRLVNEAKKMYNEAFIQSSKNKTKGIWQVINKETGNFPRNNYNIHLQHNNEVITDPQIISERFNKCFIDTINDLLNKDNLNLTRAYLQGIKTNSASMFVSPITEIEVKDVIGKLKGKHSAGYDEIPEVLVKHYSEYIVKPLTHVFNLSVKCGIFPDAMKIAKITPLFKKGDKQDIQNYRPIAVLPVFSKILEKIMYNRLLGFLKKFKILTDEQNGFRDNKSTTTACHTFIEQVQQALDNNLHAVGIFLDLTKAYDVLNHDILLYKLESYGVRGILNTWFKSYLSGRSQYVSLTQIDINKKILDKHSSSLKENLNGVPQGSLLGPLLFLIYINDLPYCFQGTKFVLYADDTNILIVDKEEKMLQRKITSVMKHLEIWFSQNDLIVNIDKTCDIISSSSKTSAYKTFN
jgi:hypothetical protein